MDDEPVELDAHRGMAAQKATDLRRLLADAETSETTLRSQLRDTEAKLIAAPAASWPEAAAKARYVLKLYASLLHTEDSRHRDLVAAVLSDFSRLSGELDDHRP